MCIGFHCIGVVFGPETSLGAPLCLLLELYLGGGGRVGGWGEGNVAEQK